MSTTFTPAEIINAAATPNWMRLNENRVNTVGANGKKKTSRSATYIGVDVCIGGKWCPLNVKFERQVLMSKAKNPPALEDGEKPKWMQVTFRKLNTEDLNTTEYDKANYQKLIEMNNEFIECLDLIANEYERLCRDEILSETNEKFALPGNKTDINSFRQTSRKESERSNKRVKLDDPLYRVRLRVDAHTQRLARTPSAKSNSTELIDYIFDAKKLDAQKKQLRASNPNAVVPTKLPARIVSGNRSEELTTENAGQFISMYSLVSGVVRFESVNLHSQGISMPPVVQELYIWRHPTVNRAAINEEELESMGSFGTQGNDEEDFAVPEQIKKRVVVDDEDEPEFEEEPEDVEEEPADEDEPEVVVKKPSKPTYEKLDDFSDEDVPVPPRKGKKAK